MIRLEEIGWLWLIILPLLLLTGYYLYAKAVDRTWKKLAAPHLQEALSPTFSKTKKRTQFIILLTSLVLLIIALANPQLGKSLTKVSRKSIDIFVVIDVSKSMLATDIKPSRIERARAFAERLIDQSKGDRVGLIIFAGTAFVQMPITADYAASKLFVRTIDIHKVAAQGTSIADAISVSMNAFDKESDTHKTLVVLSDGENHDPDAVKMAEKAKGENIIIHTIGIGEPIGALVPIEENGIASFLRDNDGNPVKTTLNEDMLKEIASIGGGTYHKLTNDKAIINDLKKSLDEIEKKDINERIFGEYGSYFQYFLMAGILLIILEWIISNKKIRRLNGKNIFDM